ncbi:hypothetical protein [Actinomadura miaoliensis]|uniref:SMI1/KNR4 family protein n=1 Tax=Actinomadura miaoliensis TaxID=430685 RepID=A0ABP7W5Y8_9ACTN
MLDDMRVLRDAVEKYRAAATAAGITWPERGESPGAEPPDLVYRLFDVDRVAEQLIWLQSQAWPEPAFPEGGYLVPWPTDGGEALENLSLSIGTPFPWRHQLTLFYFDVVFYTFVLAGDHEGEIWRYEISPDAWDAVRAADSLAALFTEWTKGMAAGVVRPTDISGDRWLLVGRDGRDTFEVLQEHDLDPFAFPVAPLKETPLRARQRECGVDMTCIDRGFDCHEELLDAIDATRASLGM